MAETDLLFSKGSPETGDITPVFFNHFERCNCTEGNKQQNDTLNYWGSHSLGIPKLSFWTKVHSSPVYVTRQHTVHLLIVNIRYWCGISITEDNKKPALSIIRLFSYFLYLVTKKQTWFVGIAPTICYIWGAHWVDVKSAMRDWGKMKWNDAWPDEDPNQQP